MLLSSRSSSSFGIKPSKKATDHVGYIKTIVNESKECIIFRFVCLSSVQFIIHGKIVRDASGVLDRL